MMMKNFIAKHMKLVLFSLAIVITILLGVLTGIILVYQKGFPQIENLEDINPKVMTVIHDDQGVPIKEFAIEKRTIIRRSDIPDILVKALIAMEDENFYSHWGISFKGTFRAVLGELLNKNLGGGSSITQQLALNLFLNRDRTWTRKFKEMLMAIQIEKKYSKDQILTFYCNKIYLGASVYGVEAASRYYFGKSAKGLSLAEAALIPTILPSPNGKYNVFKNPDNCLRKRNYILKRMLNLRYITAAEYERAISTPLPKKPFEDDSKDIGNYFVEDIRKILEAKFGDQMLYTGGLKVYTTLNSEMQRWAENSLRRCLRLLDKRRGWRGKLRNLLNEEPNVNLETVSLPTWKDFQPVAGAIADGVVLDVDNQRALVRIGAMTGTVDAKDTQWSRRTLPQTLKPGDVGIFMIKALPGQPIHDPLNPNVKGKKEVIADSLMLTLEQEPEVDGAFLAVDNKTGQIKAMVGGFDFKKSQWNNATQALRQTGSTIKPIVYAAALENGFTPASIIVDRPVVFDNPWTFNEYEPQNHTNDFLGPLTLRRALELSRNTVTAQIVEALTPPVIVQYAKNFGISADLKPYMSIGLGPFEVTLKEMVAAYTVFPNLGTRVKPYFIQQVEDLNNYILEENFPDKKQVLEPETAFLMNYLLQGVVRNGTATKARHLPAPIGGKTGTTDGFTDAWFIGFSPSITVGVWVGFDIKRPLGNEETGSQAALPAFIGFMEKYLEKYKDNLPYRRPSNIIMVKIDKYTGKLATPECDHQFMEAFYKGSEPTEFCRDEDHRMILNYYKEDEGNE